MAIRKKNPRPSPMTAGETADVSTIEDATTYARALRMLAFRAPRTVATWGPDACAILLALAECVENDRSLQPCRQWAKKNGPAFLIGVDMAPYVRCMVVAAAMPNPVDPKTGKRIPIKQLSPAALAALAVSPTEAVASLIKMALSVDVEESQIAKAWSDLCERGGENDESRVRAALVLAYTKLGAKNATRRAKDVVFNAMK